MEQEPRGDMTHESLIEVTNPADGPGTRLYFFNI